MDIRIPLDQIKKCKKFSEDCADHMRPSAFGQKEQRLKDEIVIDTFIGKIGEVAVQIMLAKKGIEVSPDFRIMDRGEWDDNDFTYNGWQADIKCTKETSQYFLIEWNKLQFRADAGELPHFFILTQLKDSLDNIIQCREACEVDVVGYVDTRSLNDNNPIVQILRRGDLIPNTQKAMTADSFCIPLKDMQNDWDQLETQLKTETPFKFDGYHVPGFHSPKKGKTVTHSSLPMHYSLLLSGNAVHDHTEDEVETYIHSGIKCILFVPQEERKEWESLSKAYDRTAFSLYSVLSADIPRLELKDGPASKEENEAFEALIRLPMAEVFNHEQYLIEHADTKQVMIVKASAGTGKTTVMIDRIMFLLATVEGLRPKDIGMITFTNHATAVMINKLQQQMLKMYHLTKDYRWQERLEELSDMQISTIDSFFNHVLGDEGNILGYGSQVKVKSYIYEKKRILQEVIDEHFQKHPVKDFLKEYVMSIDGYVNHAYNLWSQLNSRGFFREDINNMDFGNAEDAEDEKSATVNQYLRLFISEAEQRYQEFKRKQNSYTMNDIKSDMDALSRSAMKKLHKTQFRFLFIDEFQDTDNSQIRSAVWLQKLMGCQLFVVGDIKQSIYRFRGAEESAFDELKGQLSKSGLAEDMIAEFSLSKNYRTAEKVTKPLNRLFASWGEQGLLKWTEDAVSCVNEDGTYKQRKHSKFVPKKALALEIKNELNIWKKNSHVCVLTRSNNKVKEFAELCRKEKINCVAKLKGGFYQSDPVRDFAAMLGALLYPMDCRHLYNYLLTPYTSSVPDIKKLYQMDGRTDRLREYFNSLLSVDKWDTYLSLLRYEPVFTIIERIILEQNPLQRYRKYCEQGFPFYEGVENVDWNTELYKLNLNKLLRIIYENFTGEYVSILEIYSFIQNKIWTNRDEDLIYPEIKDKSSYVECMTVHKAKGDEFETVMLPYTRTPYFPEQTYDERETLITSIEGDSLKVAWAFGHRGEKLCNEFYKNRLEEEQDAVRREEARLLYVALTRAKKNLICFVPYDPDEDTWGYYLRNQVK